MSNFGVIRAPVSYNMQAHAATYQLQPCDLTLQRVIDIKLVQEEPVSYKLDFLNIHFFVFDKCSFREIFLLCFFEKAKHTKIELDAEEFLVFKYFEFSSIKQRCIRRNGFIHS